MKKALQILTIITLSSLLFYSCSKKEEGCTDTKATNYNPKAEDDDGSCTYCYEPTNPQCTNYDPCYGEEHVTAWFDAFEELGPSADADTFIVTTDNFLRKVVKFEAKEEGANYTWYIGTEIIHTREVVRSFTAASLVGQTIAVTLVVEKTPNLNCSPNDDGKDSLTRYFEVVDDCASLLADTFVGVWENEPLDTFELAIIFKPDLFGQSCYGDINFWNFNKQGVELQGQRKNITYHYIRIAEGLPDFTTPFRIRKLNNNGSAKDNSLVGFVHSDKQTVELNYTIDHDITGVITDHHFVGAKKH